MVDEDKIIPEISFPKIPDSLDEELTKYLEEFERVLRDALRGSMYMQKLLDDGIFGN